MSSLTEGRHTGEFILSEGSGAISRDAVTVDVPATTVLEAGTVLGQLSGTGHYAPYDDAHSDGSEVAAGILLAGLDNEAGLVPAEMAGVVINALAEVREDDLVWGTDVDEAGGLVDLAALFIKARE